MTFQIYFPAFLDFRLLSTAIVEGFIDDNKQHTIDNS